MRLEYNGNKISGTVLLPSSKSISNRVLIAKHLTGIPHHIDNLSSAEDTQILHQQLQKIMKRESDMNSSNSLEIIDVGNAGTAFRFLTAVLSMSQGIWLLTGSSRMQKRPCKPLVDTLISLGAEIDYVKEMGYPPLRIRGNVLELKSCVIDSSLSSQFASALLLVFLKSIKPVTITLPSSLVSLPYIDMTIGVIKSLGGDIQRIGNQIIMRDTVLSAKTYIIEADWSSASYYYELCALNPGASVNLLGLQKASIQGDSALIDIFHSLGVTTDYTTDGILIRNSGSFVNNLSIDLSNTPDLVPAIVCTCAGLGIKTDITGVAHLRIKESDRLEALSKELSKLGCLVDTRSDSFHLRSGIQHSSSDLATYDDHRLAMAFAPLVTVLGSITIESPDVVAKSFPTFWTEFQGLTNCSYTL